MLGAVAIGLASHVAIDRGLHPLINALATSRMAEEKVDHGTLHRDVEKFQSVIFHEEYTGKDAMGTSAMGRLIGVALAYDLDRGVLGASIVRAFSAAFGESMPALRARAVGPRVSRSTSGSSPRRSAP